MIEGLLPWQEWVGRAWDRTEVLEPAQANRMAATLDRDPSFVAGDDLPLAWQWLYFHDVVPASRLGDEGHPALGITMPPVPLPRRMWAGGSFVTDAPLTLGAVVTRTSTIDAVAPKQGSTGPLFLVTVRHQFHQEGQLCLTELQTIVYREMDPDAVLPPPAPASDQSDLVDAWQLDAVALFRYSALTFNGHRIHYDADYARTVEGYPGVVVHGPLLATLVADLAQRHGRPARLFDYRAHSPLFLPDAFAVHGRVEADETELWVRGSQGGLAMQARARP